MEIIKQFTERKAIEKMFIEHDLKIVHFTNLSIKDKNDIETEIISIKFDRMFYDVTLDIDGELYIVRLDSLSNIYITMIYLRLQDMIRKFND
jgi:hypothetical protein